MNEIKLTNGKVALIDDEDLMLVSGYNWFAHSDGYRYYASANITINGKRKTLKMHRLIMGNPYGKEIDHINHNGLYNRKENLRIVTHRENMINMDRKNKHGYVGVKKHRERFMAYCYKNGKATYLGIFKTPKEAHERYLKEINNLVELTIIVEGGEE